MSPFFIYPLVTFLFTPSLKSSPVLSFPHNTLMPSPHRSLSIIHVNQFSYTALWPPVISNFPQSFTNLGRANDKRTTHQCCQKWSKHRNMQIPRSFKQASNSMLSSSTIESKPIFHHEFFSYQCWSVADMSDGEVNTYIITFFCLVGNPWIFSLRQSLI